MTSTDKTWLDERLKSNLYLDLLLRAAIWLLIALLSIAYASNALNFTPADPLKKSFDSVFPVIADVSRVSLLLCLAALLLKDLEHVSPNSWGQDTAVGKIGGAIRRLAGDLSLWIVGALVSVFAAFLYFSAYAYQAGQWTNQNNQFFIVVGLVLTISVIMFSVVSVWVRKKSSLVSSHAPFAEHFNSPWKVLLFYALLVSTVIIFH